MLLDMYFEHRDMQEKVMHEYHYNTTEICRNDEIDYEIDRLLKD